MPVGPTPGDVWYDGTPAGDQHDHGMNDGFDHGSRAGLQTYIGVVLKRRWLILGITVGAVLAALVATLLADPVYIARATFQAQREAPRVIDAQSVTDSGSTSDATFLQTQFALIKSRATAGGIVRRLHLDRNADFVESGGSLSGLFKKGAPSSPAQQQRAIERATSMVEANLTATALTQSSLIQVQYANGNPQMAAKIANAAVDEFIEGTIERQYSASRYARDFVGRRLNELKKRLGKSERDLVDYAQKQRIINVTDARNPGQSQSLDSVSLNAINTALATAKAARIDAEENWRVARSGEGQSFSQIQSDPQAIALLTRLQTLQADYQQRLQAFKPTFPAMVQTRSEIATVQAQMNRSRANVAQSLRVSYELALSKEKAIEAQLGQMTGQVLDLQRRSIEYTILQREVDTNRSLYDALLQRYKEIGVAGGSGSNSISIVDRARVPGVPARPILWLNLVLALAAGLGLGLAIAFALDFLDDTFKMPEDVEQKLGLPLLGMIPKLDEGVRPVEELVNVRSSFSEAYFSARTALQLVSSGTPRSLLVTSANPSEGKSTSAVALAYSFAEEGKKVLLVDADMRRPSLHKALGQSNVRGMSNVLNGEAAMKDAIIHFEAGFDLLVCGPLPVNPARLLSNGLKPLLKEALDNYDLVLFDGPPIVGLADVLMLASIVQATVIVVQARKSRRRVVLSALRRLRSSRRTIAGVLLTKFDHRSADYAYSYDYSTYYSYGSDKAE